MTKGKKPRKETPPMEQVEIVFDFQKIDLFDFLDLLEASAKQADGDKVDPKDMLKVVRVLRGAYVSSSRPLTVADLEETMKSFYKQAEFFKNPNA